MAVRTLWLMRHGAAEHHSDAGDFGRRLTAAGIDVVTRGAQALAREQPRPVRLLHSPLVRATETAAILKGALMINDVAVHADLQPDSDPRAAVRAILGDTSTSLLVVSHLPLLPAVLELLTGVYVELGTAGVARVDVTGGDGVHECSLVRVWPRGMTNA